MIRYLLIFFITTQSLLSQSLTNKADELIIQMTSTSTSAVWTPNKIVKTGDPLIWKASATGMVDQFVTTNGTPTFDLSVSRTSSSVTITATTTDGVNGLTELRVNSLNLTSLNVDNASFLTSLSFTDNQITSINITSNIRLINLFCHSNQLKELDVSTNVQLTTLACFSNNITILDLFQNTALSTLSCSFNMIKNLDLSLNQSLTSLECDNNKLENLNVQNGNNANMNIFNATKNSDLTCIQVDDETSDFSKWKKDSWSIYNNDCTFSNRPPAANDDFYETTDNTDINTDKSNGLLSNDTDHENKPLTVTLSSDVSNGNLLLNPDGSFTYTPDKNFYGKDQFTYIASDGVSDSNIATVTIDVHLINSPPVANENIFTTIENTSLHIKKNESVLSNDTDPDKDLLTAHLEENVKHGVLNFLKDGSFIYHPDYNFYGEEIFTYKCYDGFAYSTITEVKIEVEAIIDLIVPNAFSPNNDLINDHFRPVYKGMNSVRLEIYDTWGNMIFLEEGQDLVGWDGTLKGKDAENGNYLYKITATTHADKIITTNGKLTLIK